MESKHNPKQPDLSKETVGVIGLGRLGYPVAKHLASMGAETFGHDLIFMEDLADHGIHWAGNLGRLCACLPSPRKILLFIPNGEVDKVLFGDGSLAACCFPGDIIVDCGNSYHGHSQRRARRLKEKSIGYVDSGTSGGLMGAAEGFCMACGGARDDFEKVRPVLESLAREGACTYVGPSGTGHFLKQVHNGIEYSMMQGIAEGLSAAVNNAFGYEFDPVEVARIWQHGSIIESRILDFFTDMPPVEQIKVLPPRIEGGETGRWLLEDAVRAGAPMPLLAAAVNIRLASQGTGDLSAQMLAVVRNIFGGHELPEK